MDSTGRLYHGDIARHREIPIQAQQELKKLSQQRVLHIRL